MPSTIQDALDAIRTGSMFILVDDPARENEGDLCVAAEHVTPEIINLMRKEAGGIICLSLHPELCDRLNLPLQAAENTSRHSTPFTVSIDARDGISTGVSARDRAHTIRTAVKDGARATDLVRPGHIFPLRAKDGGVLVRAGHTEA